MAAKPQVLILSSVEWGAAWQRHQIFATRWAAAGHEVFFVENTGFRDVSLGDVKRLWRKARGIAFGREASGKRQAPPGVRVVNPLVAPPTKGFFQKLNAALLVPRLVEQLQALGLRPGATVVCYLPTATTLAALELVEPSAIVYDCVDNFYGLPSAPPNLAETEGALLSLSDLVVTTSPTLRADKAARHPNVIELHQGVSDRFFLKSAPDPSFKRLCYFGTLWHALDYEAVRALAEAGFQVTLLGPRKEPPPPLPASVRLVGPLPHERLPAALEDADALLLPYRQTEYNRGVVPAKLYECLATGRPVLASPLPGLEPLGPLLTRCAAPADWVAAARALPREETGERRAARVAAARAQAEAAVFARLVEAVEAARSKRPRPASGDRPAAAGHASRLLRGFSWIGALYGLAKASTLVTQVAAGRWLGPVEFGKANVVQAASAYLQILPMLGFPTAIAKLVAEEPGDEDRTTLISSSLLAFAAWSALAVAVVAAGRGALGGALALPPSLFADAAILAFATAAYQVVSSALLGLTRFDRRGAAELLYGLSTPVFFVLLLASGRRSYRALIAALCAAIALGVLYSLWALRARLRPRFSASAVRRALPYAAAASINLLATACVLAPARLFLHAHRTAREVGVFSAYFTCTVQVALALTYMAAAVLIPLASGAEGQRQTWRWLRALAAPAGLLATGGLFAVTCLALAAFGRGYPLHASWAALFAAAAAALLVHGAASALFAARDFAGLCLSAVSSLLAGLGNVALCYWFIPRWGIPGAAAALLASYSAGLLLYAPFRPEPAP